MAAHQCYEKVSFSLDYTNCSIPNNPLWEKIIFIKWSSRQESGITWPLAGMRRLQRIRRNTDKGRRRLRLCAGDVEHNYWIAWKLEIGE